MFQLKEGKWDDLEGGRSNRRISNLDGFFATPEGMGSIFFNAHSQCFLDFLLSVVCTALLLSLIHI